MYVNRQVIAHCCVCVINIDSVIEKVTLSFAKIALRITPQVPRRAGSPDDDTAVFYVKFKTEEERNEVTVVCTHINFVYVL